MTSFSQGTRCQGSISAANQVANEEAESLAAAAEGPGLDQEGSCSPSLPAATPPPVTDPLHTPKLSDFGLSEMMLKRVLDGAQQGPEEPPKPNISFSEAALVTPEPPPLSLTPRCALWMDDDELMPPQLQDFGLSENTMCLINDFTMNLPMHRKVDKPQR